MADGAERPRRLQLETEVGRPENNKALEASTFGRPLRTQCEAEGFRKISWFADRPDVLSRYTVRIEADRKFHRLLSNGNLMESGQLPGGRHFAVWNDPFPKPCYLFALVAGELDELADSFVTMSGRNVELRIYVDPGMASRAVYAMDALKRSMKWDEEAFGREYDLDLFMIVAVRDFNFGAMENKGLNIFNSSLVLAEAETATDLDYERIEGVVAHEYFHNWTGNRITCRDWFQLCLKEGLTVFRDQEFTPTCARRLERIGESTAPFQFPRSRPARQRAPVAQEINILPATIYEKGAEVIRMLRPCWGRRTSAKGWTSTSNAGTATPPPSRPSSSASPRRPAAT